MTDLPSSRTPDDSLPALTEQIARQGYAHLRDLAAFLPQISASEEAFNRHWEQLVLDENFKDYTTRHRRILRYFYTHPGQFTLNENSVFQPKITYDVDYVQGENRLAYATQDFMQDPLVRQIVEFDLSLIPDYLEDGARYSVDVDQFRVSAQDGQISPTTSGRHQDGEDWLFMHFVGASNIQPLISTLFDRDENEAILLEAPLDRYLETLIVNDRSLYHAAGPVIQADPAHMAHRNLLLVSVSRLDDH